MYPNGGSETYIFKLGEALEQHGHEVQYFGMEHEGRCVGNRVNAYTSDMDFHGGSKLSKLTYPIKTIYSKESRVQLRKVLDDFKPDVCHLNNFNYQLTPSIILEIVKWRKETGRDCKIIFTAHDYQLVCPNHICVLQRKDWKSIAITPCAAEHPMSFKVPDRLLTDGQCRMMINGIQFIQVLLEANGLAAGKDHQFKGRYDAEKNAVIISLEKDEQSALSPQKCTT